MTCCKNNHRGTEGTEKMATAKLVPRVKRIGRILRDAKEKKGGDNEN
jgi:hypothetical protein